MEMMCLRSILQLHPKMPLNRSKTTQNDLIACAATSINEKIIKKIKSCQYYSILADEVADCSNKEQMPLVIRYIDPEEKIQERFVKLIHCDSGTKGEALAEVNAMMARVIWQGSILECRQGFFK